MIRSLSFCTTPQLDFSVFYKNHLLHEIFQLSSSWCSAGTSWIGQPKKWQPSRWWQLIHRPMRRMPMRRMRPMPRIAPSLAQPCYRVSWGRFPGRKSSSLSPSPSSQISSQSSPSFIFIAKVWPLVVIWEAVAIAIAIASYFGDGCVGRNYTGVGMDMNGLHIHPYEGTGIFSGSAIMEWML